MKVLQVNNYGYVRGGSDRYFLDLCSLLENNGHHLSYLISASPQNLVDSRFAVQGFDIEYPSVADVAGFMYSRDARRQLRRLIEAERPDVAHLHIYYGQITSSILGLLKEYDIPVVQTLHEFKLFCPVSTMIKDGKACEECAGGSYWHASWNRCNRGRLGRSVVMSVEAYVSDLLGARKGIDSFIAVSDFMRKKMISHGIKEDRISTVHNFVRDELLVENDKEGRYFLYFGRLEKMKGLETLIKSMAMIPEIDLLIVGKGEARRELEKMVADMNLKNVRFLGFQTGKPLMDVIGGAIAVVAPSECNETFGLVLLESFAQCRPVIASRIGGMTEVVSDGVDGLLIEAGNVVELKEAIEWMAVNRKRAVEMGKLGQHKVRGLFSAEKHYQDVMRIYKRVTKARTRPIK